ncbi:MAG: MerR family transcriptional regulator [Terriglobales bacterium]
METPERLYLARAFATRTGVTVRALHHYDRLGLLQPSRRSEAGYRLYSDRDIARLQQIVTLKFIGLPLKQIKGIVSARSIHLVATLRRQRLLLEERRRQMDRAIRSIAAAEKVAQGTAGPDPEALRKVIQVIEMTNNMDWTKQYYSEAAQAKIADRATLWNPELQAAVTQQWSALVADVKAAMAAGEDPGGRQAQQLVARWTELVRGFTGGDAEIQAGLNKLYADRKNWPKVSFDPGFDETVHAFIVKAMASGKTSAAE